MLMSIDLNQTLQPTCNLDWAQPPPEEKNMNETRLGSDWLEVRLGLFGLVYLSFGK